jgi:hypothetical protein
MYESVNMVSHLPYSELFRMNGGRVGVGGRGACSPTPPDFAMLKSEQIGVATI